MPDKITEVERIHLTLPSDVLQAVKDFAASEDRSISAEIARRLRKSLEKTRKRAA